MDALSSGIALTNNDIKNIMKVIKSQEKGIISLQGTAEKVKNQKEGFLGPLMIVVLPSIKNVLKPIGKNVSMLLESTASALTYWKENLRIRRAYTDNLKQKNRRYYKNCSISWKIEAIARRC